MADYRDNVIFKSVTQGIADAVTQGLAPWQRVFIERPPVYPVNAFTGKPINGINFLLLASSGRDIDPRWTSAAQSKSNGIPFRSPEDEKNGVSIVTRWAEEVTVPKSKSKGETGDVETEMKTVFRSRIGVVFNAEQLDNLPAINHADNFAFAAQEDIIGIIEASKVDVVFDDDNSVCFYNENYIQLTKNDGSLMWCTDAIRMLARISANFEDDTVARNVVSPDGKIGTREWLTTEMATYMLAAELGLPYRAAWDAPSDESVSRFLEKHNNGSLFKMASTANNIRQHISGLALNNDLDLGGSIEDLLTDEFDQTHELELVKREAPVTMKF